MFRVFSAPVNLAADQQFSKKQKVTSLPADPTLCFSGSSLSTMERPSAPPSAKAVSVYPKPYFGSGNRIRFGTSHQPTRGILPVTNATGTKQPIEMRKTTDTESDIISTDSGETIGKITLPPGSPLKVQPYSGKGGITTVVTSETTGLRYFILPGGSLRIGDAKIEMSGQPMSAVTASEAELPEIQPDPNGDDIQTMVLGAGLATRFEPVSGENSGFAKPAVPLVGQTSVIRAIADLLSKTGYNRLFVNTHFMPDSLHGTLAGTVQAAGKTLSYIHEDRPTGTAGPLFQMIQHPERYPQFDPSKPIVIIQGDAVTNADLSKLVKAHQENNALVTIGCKEVTEDEVDQFGIVVTDQSSDDGVSGVIKSFQEKPKRGEHLSTLANTGFYVISPAAYQMIRDTYNTDPQARAEELDYGKHIFKHIVEKIAAGDVPEAAKGKAFRAEKITGYWNDIGNPRQYLETMHDVYAGLTGLPLPENPAEYFENGVLYWPGAKALAADEQAKPQGNVIVGQHYKDRKTVS